MNPGTEKLCMKLLCGNRDYKEKTTDRIRFFRKPAVMDMDKTILLFSPFGWIFANRVLSYGRIVGQNFIAVAWNTKSIIASADLTVPITG